MSNYTWSNKEVADKVNWEGGIVPTLEWGLLHTDISDPTLAALWEELEKIGPILRQIEEILSNAEDEENNEGGL